MWIQCRFFWDAFISDTLLPRFAKDSSSMKKKKTREKATTMTPTYDAPSASASLGIENKNNNLTKMTMSSLARLWAIVKKHNPR